MHPTSTLRDASQVLSKKTREAIRMNDALIVLVFVSTNHLLHEYLGLSAL